MVMVDFQNVEEPEPGEKKAFEPMPDGDYKGFIKAVEERQGPKGVYYNIEWMLTDGKFKGRKVWDIVSFSIGALPRLKLIIGRLGLDVSGPMDVTTELLVGKQAWLTLFTHSYRNNDGDEAVTNKIKYDGFNLIGEGFVENPGGEDDGDFPV